MTQPTLDIDVLRIALQSQSANTATRVVAVVFAVLMFVAILETVRRRKIREELTPVWMTCAFAILALGLSFDSLIWFTNLIGAWTPSSTVFFFGLSFLLVISLGYAVRLSQLSSRVEALAQELAIMRARKPAIGDENSDVCSPGV